MLNIREEFVAKRVMGNHTVWKAPTEEELKMKIYKCLVREIKRDVKRTPMYYGGKATIAPFEEMKKEYTPVVGRRKYSVSFVDGRGDVHKHYMAIEYGHYGYVVA